jgi:hypothetical protein
MSSTTETLSTRWPERTRLPGVITASLLTVVVVSTIVGGFTGMALHGAVTPVVAAVLAGLLGTVIAGIVRNTLLVRVWHAAGVHDVGTPVSVVISAAVASLAGSLAAFQMVSGIGPLWSGVTGMLAGFLSAGLMALLMLVHSLDPTTDGADR